MTRIIYVVYTKEYLTSRQIIGANLKKKSIFSSFIEKYKSQFIPEKDNTLKVSMDGNICVPMNSEYEGIFRTGM